MIRSRGVALYLAGIACLALAGLSCGDRGGETSSVNTNASTGTATNLQPPPFKATEFTQSSVCGGCHTDIYQQWQGSMMNNSITDRLYLAVYEEQNHETGGKYDAFCVACHTPIGSDSQEAPPPTGAQISPVTREGIQCDFCHTLTSPDAYQPGPLKTGPFNDSVSSFHQSAYLELSTKSEFCGNCHDMVHPDTGVPLQTTYTEWQNGPYAAEGVQCQDCHLTPGPGVTKPNPGKAALSGPDRPHIYTHEFTGGNVTALASPAHQQQARERLAAAATVQIVPAAVVPGADLQLQVNVTNNGAGHNIPTGVTEIREMWLEVLITDASGQTAFWSGGMDEHGEVESQAVKYYTLFKDKDGKPTLKPWEAAGIILDHRIPPKGTVTETYTVPTSAGVTLPLTARATLHYRSASPGMVEDLIGAGALELPVIDMATDQKLL